jgi:integrase/recombinase XerD
MSGLRDALEDYLAVRRSLGFKMERSGQLLAGFVGFAEQAGAPTVTTDLALAWATAPAGASSSWWRVRLDAVRPFARYLAAFIPGTEVPPAGLLPGPASHRAVPYLYSPAQIAALVTAAGAIRAPLRAATCQTLIGLLAVTGMRVSEAIGLDRPDVDLQAGLLTIRDSKSGKSRQLPLHATTVTALAGYAALRDRHHPRPATPAFLVSLTGTRLAYRSVNRAFRQLTTTAGLAPRSARCRPRIHDLRHSFAVTTLLGWYQDGSDVAARLPLLSAWLGHASPGSTYWYLTGTPELLALAGQRLEHHLRDQP